MLLWCKWVKGTFYYYYYYYYCLFYSNICIWQRAFSLCIDSVPCATSRKICQTDSAIEKEFRNRLEMETPLIILLPSKKYHQLNIIFTKLPKFDKSYDKSCNACSIDMSLSNSVETELVSSIQSLLQSFSVCKYFSPN